MASNCSRPSASRAACSLPTVATRNSAILLAARKWFTSFAESGLSSINRTLNFGSMIELRYIHRGQVIPQLSDLFVKSARVVVLRGVLHIPAQVSQQRKAEAPAGSLHIMRKAFDRVEIAVLQRDCHGQQT